MWEEQGSTVLNWALAPGQHTRTDHAVCIVQLSLERRMRRNRKQWVWIGIGNIVIDLENIHLHKPSFDTYFRCFAMTAIEKYLVRTNQIKVQERAPCQLHVFVSFDEILTDVILHMGKSHSILKTFTLKRLTLTRLTCQVSTMWFTFWGTPCVFTLLY